MNLNKLLSQYATLAIKSGVNLQKNQLLVINASIDCYEFVHLVAKKAFEAGAKDVKIKWIDDQLSKLKYQYASDETLASIPQYLIDERQNEIDQKCAYLTVLSPNPMVFKDVDPKKMQINQKALGEAFKPFRNYTASSLGQWSIVLVPNITWAKLIYPNLEEQEAVSNLWGKIFICTRVKEDNDLVANWNEHLTKLKTRSSKLNQDNFKTLHFKNNLGTNLTVDLIDNHIWAGGSEETPEGVVFLPNIPTEEIFTMPHKYGVNGKVYATKPLNYQGKLIEEFWFEFKNGKVINYGATKNEETLKNLLDLDEGSRYLGEVALISHYSPISDSQLVFYNTLFDENASCHLALGNCYPMNIENGVNMPQGELEKLGANFSLSHSDFMFGSADMSITATKKTGEEVVIFKNGDFTF
jgi:Leucyl aminopeptidase (aminopeptidase T)